MSLITQSIDFIKGARRNTAYLWNWSKRVRSEAQVDLKGKIDLSESGWPNSPPEPIFTADVVKQTAELIRDLGVACFPRPLTAVKDLTSELIAGVRQLQINGVCQTAGYTLRTNPQAIFPSYAGDETINIRTNTLSISSRTPFHSDYDRSRNALVSIGYEPQSVCRDNGLELVYNWLGLSGNIGDVFDVTFFQPYYRFKCDRNEYPFIMFRDGQILHANRDVKRIFDDGGRYLRKVDVIPAHKRDLEINPSLIPVNQANEEMLLKYAMNHLVYRR